MSLLQKHMTKQQHSSLPYSGIDRSAKSRDLILPKSPPTVNTSGTASTSFLSDCDASLPSPQSSKATLQEESNAKVALPALALQDYNGNLHDRTASSPEHDDLSSKVVLELPAHLLEADKPGKQELRYSHGKTNRLIRSLAQLRNRRQQRQQKRHRRDNSWDDEDNMSAIAVWCEDDVLTLEDVGPSVHPFFAGTTTEHTSMASSKANLMPLTPLRKCSSMDVTKPSQASNASSTASLMTMTPPRRCSSMQVDKTSQRSPPHTSPFRKQIVEARRAQLGFARTIAMDGILESHDRKSRRETSTVLACAPSRGVNQLEKSETGSKDSAPALSLDYQRILKEESPQKIGRADPPLRQSLSDPVREEQPAILIWV